MTSLTNTERVLPFFMLHGVGCKSDKLRLTCVAHMVQKNSNVNYVDLRRASSYFSMLHVAHMTKISFSLDRIQIHSLKTHQIVNWHCFVNQMPVKYLICSEGCIFWASPKNVKKYSPKKLVFRHRQNILGGEKTRQPSFLKKKVPKKV